MKLTRAILLALAFALPTTATVAHAQDKEKTAEPAPDAKKAKKSKKAKKEGEEKKDDAAKEEPKK
jgi:hypothetical protein